jgi:hypothetical protein
MAYKSNEARVNQVFIESFPDRGAKVQVSIGGGSWPRWRDDNRELFFLSPDNTLMSAAVTANNSVVEVGEVGPLFPAPSRPAQNTVTFVYDVTADGQRFLFNAPREDTVAPPIAVVVNWLEEFKKPGQGK